MTIPQHGRTGTADVTSQVHAVWNRGPGEAQGARSIDLRYLDRDPRTSRRPYFLPVLRRAGGHQRADDGLRLLDVGCANGAFAGFVLDREPHWEVSGIDVLPDLVVAASSAFPRAQFSVADICSPRSLPAERFDVVTALTVPSHFDTLDTWLPHLLGLVAPGGMAVLCGPLNPVPVDLVCRLRYAHGDAEWLPGWNVLSQQTYESFLTGRARSWTYEYLPVAGLGYPGQGVPDALASRIVPAMDGERLGNDSGLTYHMACVEIHP